MKPTIASLKKKIDGLETNLREERIRTGLQNQRADKAHEELHQFRQDRRTENKQAEDALTTERRSRENAESIYDQHRSAVLHYFIAVANPETAKDVKRIAELQGAIIGLVPSRGTEHQDQFRRFL